MSLYIYIIYTAAERLGHGPYPRHCLALLLSPDTAKNARIRMRSCTRSYFLCGRHLCVGHDLVERSPRCTAVQVLQKDVFVGALLLFTPIYLLQVPNQLLDGEYSIQCSIVQEVQRSNTVVSYSIVMYSTVQYRTVQYSNTVVQSSTVLGTIQSHTRAERRFMSATQRLYYYSCVTDMNHRSAWVLLCIVLIFCTVLLYCCTEV